MKTKEEILKPYRKGITPGEWEVEYDNILEAMTTYAQQQAILFDEYRRENNYIFEYGRQEYMKFGAAYIHEPRLSPQQLYTQFIESQKQY